MFKPYTVHHIERGIWQIWDAMGVGMTLIAGDERALLFDAGYGLWDIEAAVSGLTDKPLTVVLSHAHHDHALGALRLGQTVGISEADLPFLSIYTASAQRQRILDAAQSKGMMPDDWAAQHYLEAPFPQAVPLESNIFDLGGLCLRVVSLPGHTPGSIGLICEERGLLLAADSWNPQTWVFFPECSPVAVYRQSLRSLLDLSFGRVLVSHDPKPRPAARLRDYITGLTDEALDGAEPWTIEGHEAVFTRRCFPIAGSPLIFDRDKWRSDGRG